MLLLIIARTPVLYNSMIEYFRVFSLYDNRQSKERGPAPSMCRRLMRLNNFSNSAASRESSMKIQPHIPPQQPQSRSPTLGHSITELRFRAVSPIEFKMGSVQIKLPTFSGCSSSRPPGTRQENQGHDSQHSPFASITHS